MKITLVLLLIFTRVNCYAQYLMNNTAGSYTDCSGTFQDSGGGGLYGYNEISTLTFYPSDPNSKLIFNFTSFSLETNYDFLFVYDGPNASSSFIGGYTGSNGPPDGIILATNPQGAITFRFSSDNENNWDGWLAFLTCIPNGVTFYNMNSQTTPKVDTVCQGIFTDAGGLTGNYGFYSNSIHTFYPATPNSSVQMDFSFFNTESDYDGLIIYNGPDTTYPIISSNSPVGLDPITCPAGAHSGAGFYPNIIQSTDISGALTYVFKSNATVVKPGWLASISCVPNPGTFVFMNDAINTHTLCNASFYDSGSDQNNYNNNENYTQTFIPSTPSSNIKLDFGNVNLGAGDTLWVYNGLNTTENILATFTWDSNSINVISTHPTGALTVKFKSDASGTSLGWHAGVSCTPIIVPYITMSNVTSPYSTCFGNFYDSGGPTQPYGNSSVQTLTLLPSTPNYVLQVNFLNFDTQAGYDGFLIYDGPSINSPLISSGQPAGISALNCPAGAFSGSQSPGLITSSDPTGALTFVFRSGTSGTAAGWKATVNCVDPNTVILADFVSNITQINAGGSVNFTDLSSNNPTSWLWSFPGGTPASSTSQNPSNIVYNTPGCYAVTLTASNAFGNGTHTETCYITVNAVTTPPVASFMANSLSITAGGSVNFTDLSTNNPIIWDWTFNGGTPSTSTFQNPSNIVYNTPGCYTVTLDVWNSFGNDIETQTCYITVNPPNIPPVAAFTANTNSIIAGSNVNFTDQSSNNPSSWLWTFTGGNPSSSTLQNPTNIVYSTPGCYAVTLVATNASGNDTETQTCYINVTNAPAGCTELFISEYIEGSGNNKALEFYNPSISALDLTGYAVELYTNGGTTVSSSYNFTGNLPSHQVFVLANTGANATILAQADATSAVCGFNGNDAIVLKKNGIVIDVIGVVGDNPGGSWAVGSGSTAENTLVRNTSVDGPTTSWITSTTQWTVHPAGTISYLGSHISNCAGVVIAPVASFTSNTQNITTGQSVNFTDLSTNNPTSWSWTFTGGTTASSSAQNPSNITYNAPGCYQVSLTATNSAGSNTSTQTCYITVTNAVIAPVANFIASTFNITTGQSVNFTDLSINNPTSWSWTFTGGTPASSTSQNPSNIAYNTPGCYQVSLTVTNNAGSNTSTQTCYITVTNAVITPVANFTSNTQNITTGQSVNFTDLSTNNPTSWSWNFNGGTPASSTSQNPTNIMYNAPGCYQVSLTATNSAGSNTSTQTCYITVTNTVITPVANFTANTQNITAGQSVNFTDLSTNNPNSWSWNFNGGTPASSTSQNPTNITYNAPGCYQVSLTATNSAGSNTSTQTCYITVTNPVIVPVANFTASAFNVTSGQSVNFTDLSSNNPTSWSWVFTGAAPVSSTSQNPSSITYNTAGCYQVSLTATNSAGSNTSTQTCYITVTNPIITPVANFTANTQFITVGQSVNFTDLSTNNPTTWNWVFTGAMPASSTSQNPTNITYNTGGCYQVALTATNTAGSNTSTQTCFINVVPAGIQPQADFSINPNPACTNADINLINTSTNALTFNWEMIDANPSTSNVQFPIINYAAAGIYQIKLIAINGANSDTLTQTITVNPTPVMNTNADESICFGSSTTLNASASGNVTYNWTPSATLTTPNQSSTIATPTANTDYVITISDAFCSASDTVTVTVWPLPPTPTITQVGNTLEATTGYPAYQWYLNSTLITGETQSIITPTSNGNYTVDAIDTNGCISTSQDFPFVIQGMNSVSNNNVNIYPNPASTNVTIELITPAKNASVEIIDVQGKIILSEKISCYQTRLNIEQLSNGFYYVRINNNKQTRIEKLVKQ